MNNEKERSGRPLGINIAIILLLFIAFISSCFLLFNILLKFIFDKVSTTPLPQSGVTEFFMFGVTLSVTFWFAGIGLYYKKAWAQIPTYVTILPLSAYLMLYGIIFSPLPEMASPLFVFKAIENFYKLAVIIFFFLPSILVFINRKSLLDGNSTGSRSESANYRLTKPSTPFSLFKSAIPVVAIILFILTPIIDEIINTRGPRLYSNVPLWHMPWTALILTSQTVILWIAFIRKQRLWIYIFLLLAVVAFTVDALVFMLSHPEVHFFIRIVSIGLLLFSIKYFSR